MVNNLADIILATLGSAAAVSIYLPFLAGLIFFFVVFSSLKYRGLVLAFLTLRVAISCSVKVVREEGKCVFGSSPRRAGPLDDYNTFPNSGG